MDQRSRIQQGAGSMTLEARVGQFPQVAIEFREQVPERFAISLPRSS
jgi:hypothetical protein